jgi:hypothetical protein
MNLSRFEVAIFRFSLKTRAGSVSDELPRFDEDALTMTILPETVRR